MAQLGFIPRGGEGFDYGGYRFTVLEMDHRRVSRVKLQRLPPVAEPMLARRAVHAHARRLVNALALRLRKTRLTPRA